MLRLLLLIPSICLAAPSLYNSPKSISYEYVSTTTKAVTTGTKSVLFLRVEFGDVKFQPDACFEDLISRFVDYYREVSDGKLSIVATFSKTYTLDETMGYYGAGNEKIEELKADARATATDINLSGYHHIMILHAGCGEETSDNDADIFSQWLGDSIIPEMEAYNISPLGVWCHEFAHYLGIPINLPFGYWSLMDVGCYNGNGDSPAHLDGYSKYKLDWITPQGTENLTLSLKPTSTVYMLGTGYEYFLVEWRERKGFDSFIPGDGFLAYHIKEVEKWAVYPADNNWDNLGDSGDPYPGSTGRREVTFAPGLTFNLIFPSVLSVKAYPNPLNLARNTTCFFDAPPKSLIKIYNINGELVGEAKDRYIGKMSWRPKDIASGVYIFVAEDPEGNRGYGKIGVIK
ncbi:hypothetical protein KKG61_09090 [bacterium]|nr:hypothetical protein [bacterium]MBU1600237.1 hypothetical protein [bacterium]